MTVGEAAFDIRDVSPDALLRVTLWDRDQGGLRNAIRGPFVGFPLRTYDGISHMNDCRLILGQLELTPGSTADLGAIYLSPEEAHRRFPVGTRVTLWAGRDVGEAIVLQVADPGRPLPTLRERQHREDGSQ